MYATLKQSELDELLAATDAPNSAVRVVMTSDALTITLTKVVAITNFKALANLGRQGMASFDVTTKTTTIPLRDKASLQPGQKVYGEPVMSDAHGYVFCDQWDRYAAILGVSYEQAEPLMKLVRRLAGGKAKTFTSTKAAVGARLASAQKRRAAPVSTREVWSDDEGDFVQSGEGWRR